MSTIRRAVQRLALRRGSMVSQLKEHLSMRSNMRSLSLRPFILITLLTTGVSCVSELEEHDALLEGELDGDDLVPSKDDFEESRPGTITAEIDGSNAAAEPVFLGTGVFTTGTDCGASAWKSPSSGNSHAGIQSCSITWG